MGWGSGPPAEGRYEEKPAIQRSRDIAHIVVLVCAATVRSKYNDPDTGLTFSWSYEEYILSTGYFSFRTAQAPEAQNGDDYDIVLQIVAPNSIGWLGLALGGSMVYNPLLVAWKGPTTAQPAVISSRWAECVHPWLRPRKEPRKQTANSKHRGHSAPKAYPEANLTIYKQGTKSNNTHWQVTARCQGCTSWSNRGSPKYINPKGSQRIAWAFSNSKPSQPSNVNSAIPYHGTPNYFNHEFSTGSSTNYVAAVQKLQVLG